jgi:hypothetical protein
MSERCNNRTPVEDELCNLPGDETTNIICYAYNGGCYSSCPVNTDADEVSNICVGKMCIMRDARDVGTCNLPLDDVGCFLYDGDCYLECPFNTLPDEITNICLPVNCTDRQVIDDEKCWLKTDYPNELCYEYDGHCFVGCPDNTVLDEKDQKTCVKEDRKSRSSSAFPWWIFLIVGVIVATVLIIIIIFILKKRKKKNTHEETKENNNDMNESPNRSRYSEEDTVPSSDGTASEREGDSCSVAAMVEQDGSLAATNIIGELVMEDLYASFFVFFFIWNVEFLFVEYL